jgi:hypothetical protein
MQAGFFGKVRRGHGCSVGHRFVNAEAVTEQNACTGDRSTEIADKFADKLIQLIRIWLTHCRLLPPLTIICA